MQQADMQQPIREANSEVSKRDETKSEDRQLAHAQDEENKSDESKSDDETDEMLVQEDTFESENVI